MDQKSADLKYWYLHDHKLFRNLSFSEIDSLCLLMRFRKTKKNEIVDLPHNDKERIYILKQGTLKLIRIGEDGEEVLLDILKKGDLFGELDLGEGQPNDNYIKVVSDDAVVCTFYKEKLEEVMLKKPDFALSYIKFVGFNFKKIQNSYKNIFFKDAKTRLLLLLEMIADKEEIEGNEMVLPSYITQKDLAQLICTTRQTVISLLKELHQENYLSYSTKEIKLNDIQRLKKFAESVK